jgi:hypothetical protein
MKRSQEIEEMWKQNKNNPDAIHNVRLRLVIDGVGVGAGAGSTSSIQSPMNVLSTPTPMDNPMSRTTDYAYKSARPTAAPTEDGGRLDELNHEEV